MLDFGFRTSADDQRKNAAMSNSSKNDNLNMKRNHELEFLANLSSLISKDCTYFNSAATLESLLRYVIHVLVTCA